MSKVLLSHQEKDYSKIKVNITKSNEPSEPQTKYGYDPIINFYRDEIDNISSDHWKKVRWYINEYDFLVKDPIINRAFYKYWEIINEFDIFNDFNLQTDIILHCAEAPGGFIQGTNIFLQLDRMSFPTALIDEPDSDGFVKVKPRRKKDKVKCQYKVYTISLNKDLPQYKAYNLPSFNKNVLNKHVCITYGKDNTGDINNWDNIKHLKSLMKQSCYLITADGGFDEGTDFNNKEQLHYGLILSEIYTALTLQAANGHFILKIFDIFTETSIHLLYLLYNCYKEVHIYKPKTSRPTNSEKYIICKYFNLNFTTEIQDALLQLQSNLKYVPSKHVSFTIFETIPSQFVKEIKHINSIFLQKQSKYLEQAVQLCTNKDFLVEYDLQLEQSIENRKQVFEEWANNYNLHAYI